MENENIITPMHKVQEGKRTAQTSEKKKNTNRSKLQTKKRKKLKALGLIETRGFVVAINATDLMLKAADVDLIAIEKIGSGLVSIIVCGDIGAVKAAVEAGTETVSRFGELVAAHVIPRPYTDVEKIFPAVK